MDNVQQHLRAGDFVIGNNQNREPSSWYCKRDKAYYYEVPFFSKPVCKLKDFFLNFNTSSYFNPFSMQTLPFSFSLEVSKFSFLQVIFIFFT